MKGGGEEGERERERALALLLATNYATALNIEVDPYCCRFAAASPTLLFSDW